LGPGWKKHSADPEVWAGIAGVNDGELWETHQVLKARLLEFVRRRMAGQCERRGDSPAVVEEARQVLSPEALTIGFGRRFATYKRATLLLRMRERLAGLVNNPLTPVQLLFAGKAHPRDEPGKHLLQEIAGLNADPSFAGRVLLIEDYD